MFRWRLYYEYGSVFGDSDGAPHESPPWGCVALAQPGIDPPIMVNADYYLWRLDLNQWTQCGTDGLDDHMCHEGHLIQCVRKTRWIPTLDFREIWRQARMDCGLKP